MKIALYSDEVKTWHEIVLEGKLDFSQIIEWCLDYNSPYRFNCNLTRDTGDYYRQTLILKFESQEDHMICAFRWLGL